MRKNWWQLAFIIVIVGLSIAIVYPKGLNIGGRDNFQLGLDLKGGVQLTYSLDTSNISDRTLAEVESGVTEVINRRINSLGVTEPTIHTTDINGQSSIIIELPGVSDVESAKEMIGQTAQLIFKELNENQEFIDTDLTGADLKKATATLDTSGSGSSGFNSSPIVQLDFTSEGGDKFEAITSRNLQKQVAIYLDDQVISAPTVESVISDGSAVITNMESLESAKELAKLLNAGSLPVPIKLIGENRIGATLGQNSVQTSVIAGILGILLVIIFMLTYYRRAGLFASIALLFYMTIALALFKLIPVTVTLAGIAGFIFSVGIAVDANVLVYERMKEELKRGKDINTAIEDSFKRSWSSIWPSNMASLITALILYFGTTGMIRGFAVTLALGIFVSLFTAVFVTRTLLRIWGNRIKKVTI